MTGNDIDALAQSAKPGCTGADLPQPAGHYLELSRRPHGIALSVTFSFVQATPLPIVSVSFLLAASLFRIAISGKIVCAWPSERRASFHSAARPAPATRLLLTVANAFAMHRRLGLWRVCGILW